MITVRTIFGFLLYRRDAILQIASSSSARWLGLLFVLSAGFAREYDGEYLIAEPWHLLLPLAASLIGCAVLVILLRAISWSRGVREIGIISIFLAVLNVYWMTSPMAWLYAIPFERWMDPGNATRANLLLLGVVSLWRVSLMIRSVSVLFQASLIAASMPVMLFCLSLGFAAFQLIPSPIFMVMGGIRLSDGEEVILGVRFLLAFAGILTAPIWIIGFIVSCNAKAPWTWRLRPTAESIVQTPDPDSSVARDAWIAAVISLVIWLPVLPWTQHEQWLRYRAERLLMAGSITELCQWTQNHDERSFPPHWDPPPRIGYGETSPPLFRTIASLHTMKPASWFLKLYDDKFEQRCGSHFFEFSLDDEELNYLADLLESGEVAGVAPSRFAGSFDYGLEREGTSEARRKTLKRLQTICKHKSTE